jgi:hypothetical protein
MMLDLGRNWVRKAGVTGSAISLVNILEPYIDLWQVCGLTCLLLMKLQNQ